ncbi:MAG: hypothetical protein AAGU11_05850 [Syntrophobacteraceae bacterium]
MGYAEVYRQSRNPWKRAVRYTAYVVVFSVLLYCSLRLLGAQSGLMVGGAMPGRDSGVSQQIK